MTKFLIVIAFALLSLICHCQDGIGKTQNQILALYPSSEVVQQEVLSNKLFITNKTENWKKEFDFENGKCFVEKLYFPRGEKQQWVKKIQAQGWKYNKLWHWYFLKKGGNKYYAEFILNDWELDYLLFEIKSAGWMDDQQH